MIEALDIRVRGIVQGVGFRPFVYRLAKRHLVSGWVLNDLDGVFIHAEAETPLLDEFVTELHMNPPSAAKIDVVELKEVPLQDCEGFEIRESQLDDAEEVTLVSADLGICDDCLRELLDATDRRYRYPFINCTNCGPRFTIIDGLPYDRPATSMRAFEMCDACAREYADPADRRFHAQPDACFECGPQVSWWKVGDAEPLWADSRETSDDVFARAVELLADGGIVAVKGLGGFHLACDASNADAVAELRRRKHRDGKPLAIMVESVAAARELCEVSEAEEALLRSPARPIVLLRKRADAGTGAGAGAGAGAAACAGAVAGPGVDAGEGAAAAADAGAAAASAASASAAPAADAPVGASVAPGVADGLPELGVMLPATPVQVLLVRGFCERTGASALVMTSGNVHDEPIVCDDDEARRKLGGIADAVLGNNRAILSRYDDSVVRIVSLGGEEALQLIRRARGYAPVPVGVPHVAEQAPAPGSIFAAGPEQKNTFAYLREGEAYVSQHIGDMEDADVNDAWFEAKERIEHLFDLAPTLLACDRHPEYLASKWARSLAEREGLPLHEVQHHHAHIASVLGEHGLFGPCCGIAFDGTGYGADGAIWGGEVLLANQADYERFANFSYVPMPGGAACVCNPLRMAYGVLWAFDLLDHPGARATLDALGEQADVCERMIEAGLNTPYTSSVGRLFDAVAALLGVCTEATYEGEPAILLDAARARAQQGAGAAAHAEGDCGPSADASSTDAPSTGAPSADAPSTPAPSAGAPSAAAPAFAPSAASAIEERFPVSATARARVTIAKNAATETSTAHDTSVVLLDAEPVVRAVLDDIQAGVAPGEIALGFHLAMVDAIVQVAELVRAMYDISLVALSGGCFMNRFLLEESVRELGARGFTVAVNGNLPPNDGCISYGQAVVARAAR